MDGTRLEVHGTLGRVVVATRSFAPGEVVMAEQPLIVFDASNRTCKPLPRPDRSCKRQS